MDEFQRDPLMDVLAQVTQKAYPNGKVMKWADELVTEYGQDATIKALGKASSETEPHLVLGLAQEILVNSKALGERVVEKEKEEDIAEARADRTRSQQDYFRGMKQGSTDMRSLSELMPDVKLGANRGK